MMILISTLLQGIPKNEQAQLLQGYRNAKKTEEQELLIQKQQAKRK